MIRVLIVLLSFLALMQVSGQNQPNEQLDIKFQKDTTFVQFYVFDYFRQERDSIVVASGVFLMAVDSVSLFEMNEYRYVVSNPENGYLEIYFKNRLLYKYRLIKGDVSGMGYCFYPFSRNVALQGQFRDGKLDGLVLVQSERGEMIEIMRFKHGKYRNHIFHRYDLSKRSLRERSKNRSSNPLRKDELITR